MLRGPIVCIDNWREHEAYFCDNLGYIKNDSDVFDSIQTQQLTGAIGVTLESCFLRKPNTWYGVRLWKFDPSSRTTIRDPQRGTDRNALKVIDFYAPNFDAAVSHLEDGGYSSNSAIASYDLPEGHFKEAHYWLPDNIVCAVLNGPDHFMSRFVAVSDDLFSEPLSVSAPVSDLEAVVDFYRSVFGFESLYEYEIRNPSFDALVGSDQPLKLKAINVGSDLQAPYLGLIDYGDSVPGSSLVGKSRPPTRGLLGVELYVSSIEKIVAAAQRMGVTIVAQPVERVDGPIGPVLSCLIEGPHGVMHHVIESATSM